MLRNWELGFQQIFLKGKQFSSYILEILCVFYGPPARAEESVGAFPAHGPDAPDMVDMLMRNAHSQNIFKSCANISKFFFEQFFIKPSINQYFCVAIFNICAVRFASRRQIYNTHNFS